MKVQRNGRKHHFYPASAIEVSGRVRLDGHYKSPSGSYVRTSRFVTKAKASKLGFHDKTEAAVGGMGLIT
jgi:hypothetical protein